MTPATQTPAQSFSEDVQRDTKSLQRLANARVRLQADLDQAKKDRCRRETALHLAWQEFTEYHGRESALEAIARSEEGHCPLAAEWFASLSAQVEELGL